MRAKLYEIPKMMGKPQVGYALATCAWCSGTGTSAVSAGYISSCRVCGGKGRVSVGQPLAACQPCEGTGRRVANRPCLRCAGTGWGRVFT